MKNEFTVRYPLESFVEWMTEQATHDEVIQPEYQTLSVQEVFLDSNEGYLIVDGTITSERIN